MKKLIVWLVFLLPVLAFANTSVHLDTAPINPGDQASLQRGAKVFINYCLNCHSANSMRYNRLADIGLSDEQIKANLLFTAEKVGEPMSIAMSKKDAKTWFGATPPDLSVEVRARGVDWLYSYLRGFYKDDTRPTGWNNVVFDKVGMPHVLWQLQGEQILQEDEATHTHKLVLAKPGTMSPSEYNAMIADLVNYMAFMAEPFKQRDHKTGLFVLFFLLILIGVSYSLKKEFWKDIH